MTVRDAQAIALGAMWEAIRIHPDPASTAVLHRLGMDALGIITRTHTRLVKDPEFATSPELVDEARESATSEPDVSTLEDLATVLRWALEAGIVSRNDIRVLAAVDLGEPADRNALAAEFNIAVSSLVRRSHRIRSRLRAAIGDEIAAYGRW